MALIRPNDAACAAETVARTLLRLPLGTFRGRSLGHEWLVTRSLFAGGASEKLVARAFTGGGYISANLYRLECGPRLRPCEMPAARVVAFVEDLTVIGGTHSEGPQGGSFGSG